jgi:hypothetical protein
MNGHRPYLALVAVFALLASGPAAAKTRAPGAGTAQTAEAFVTAFYRGHFARRQRWDLTFARERAKFAPDLLALLDADARKQAATPDEVVGLDFDPVINAQEEATRYKVSGVERDGDASIVTVSVYFGTEHRTVRVRLEPFGTSWRIANFLYEEGDLISILKEPAA